MTFKNSFYKLIVLISVATMYGCSSSPDDDDILIGNRSESALYDQAKESMSQGNFNVATEILSTLDSRFPFGPHSHQVQLDLIYSYYKVGKTDEAIATIDRFVRLNPNHSDVDYALYMRGLTNLDADKNLFQELVGIDRSDRDPSRSREAFADFRRLINKFPDSKYAADAKKRMVFIKNRLAKYEIAIARFYMRREAYVAAANRGRYVLEYFPDSSEIQNALEIMVECYDQLDLEDLKNNALKTLKLNYPDSRYVS
ncbi:outer membrane protein assembly factor BamD [Aliiglaciecola sp. 3_MG-2023]|uniref:outer membrane protein assembly factor BamD n=1 Tax=Aliiglaciecola sp. 3_MG-2023 TaxID=3062644 RepID=UPI0026E1DEB6|nr:outer membrane protein assembly factor BamD [Aliiglaciecola sp. 3_MG-2023]MDO6693944.1 outer membrane protein assembly factor BamD [Aliiglaciecola sp. 3_MG-2023]